MCPQMLDLNPIFHPDLRPENTNLKSLVMKLYLPTITPGSRNRNADARAMNCLHVPALQNPHEMIEAARKFAVDLKKWKSGEMRDANSSSVSPGKISFE